MRKRLLSIFIVLGLILSMVPAAFAANSPIIRVSGGTSFDGDYNSLEEYTTAYATAAYYGSIEVPFTVTLLDDLTINSNGTTSAGLLIGGNTSDEPSVLDLDGHIITVTGTMGILAMGTSNSPMVVCNGNINISSNNAAAIMCMDGSLTLSEIIITADENVTGATGLMGNIAGASATKMQIENSIFNLGDGDGNTDISDSGAVNADYVTTIVSGQFGNMNADDNDDNIELANGSSPLKDFDEVSGTVITSDATTALIVDGGNAYLYDTLQDAVNAASRRVDDDGKVTIQLLKQPESTNVTLPEDAPEGITITKLDANNEQIALDDIQMTDSDGNTVTVGDDGTLNTTIAVQSVALDKTSLDLYVGGTAALTATVEPGNATNPEVVWSTSNPSIATVDGNGNVTAVGDGAATITASAGDASAECVVTVSTYVPPANPSYRITIADAAHGTVTADPAAARQGTTVTLTVTPEEGYAVDEITVTDFFGNRVEVSRNSNGTYSFVMPYSQVEVDVTFTRTEEPIRFTDVPEGAYYYDAVYWAVENGVTVGATATTFNPGGSCTRAQMVTFLWRAAGSPEPATTVNPFTDVDANDYYYEAVLWAVENGVTVGATATTFNPGGECTRSQMVTFLWRAAGEPGTGTSSNPFTDVDADDYYCEAVLWAVENGITVGATATTFAPVAVCTRAQAVTFLYRDRV